MKAALLAGALLAAMFATGCQSRAWLTQAGRELRGGPAQTSPAAWFDIDDNGRQTIVLAFEPTGSTVDPAGPPTPEGLRRKPVALPMQYRRYVVLMVQRGGGRFRVGQRILGGQVRAIYYTYNDRNEPMIVPDREGRIDVMTWPLTARSSDDWWLTGTYNVEMSNDLRLRGRFVAKRAQMLVQQFLKDRQI